MLNDSHKESYVKYLRPVDQERLLVNTAYKVANSSANRVASFSIPSDDTFLDSLTVDENSSYIIEKKVNDINFTLSLSNSQKPNRNKTREEQLQHLKYKLKGIKKRIIEKLISNIRDQNYASTFFFSWAGLDLSGNKSLLHLSLLALEVKLSKAE